MINLYLFCFIPLIIGLFLWITQKEITWLEWISGTAIAFVTVLIIHGALYAGLTTDVQILSGHIIKATFYPEWIEEYQASHQSCTGSGKYEVCTTYYTTEHRTHHEYWSAESSTGESNDVDVKTFKQIADTFKNYNTEDGNKIGFDGGDPNVYTTYNKLGIVYFPTTTTSTWTNIIKATKSNFSFVEVPKNVKVYEYPLSNNWFESKRLINTNSISIYDWDVLNSELGASKKVNLILINFGNLSREQALIQESAWLGGKKNDLVLCFGNGWSYVFGWTENNLVKRNLETIILKNKIDKNILPKIKKEVVANYVIKDFSKFNYMSITPPSWAFILTFIIMLITQGFLWCYAYTNGIDKER